MWTGAVGPCSWWGHVALCTPVPAGHGVEQSPWGGERPWTKPLQCSSGAPLVWRSFLRTPSSRPWLRNLQLGCLSGAQPQFPTGSWWRCSAPFPRESPELKPRGFESVGQRSPAHFVDGVSSLDLPQRQGGESSTGGHCPAVGRAQGPGHPGTGHVVEEVNKPVRSKCGVRGHPER